MNNLCFVPDCEGTTGVPFPRDLKGKQKWLENLNIVDKEPDTNSFICCSHFNESDIKEIHFGVKKVTNRVKRGAYPTNRTPSKTSDLKAKEENSEPNDNDEIKFENICGACMTTENLTTSLNVCIEDEITYGSVFMLCAYPVDVFEDTFNKELCKACAETLTLIYKFRKKFIESYNSLPSNQQNETSKRKHSEKDELEQSVKRMKSSKLEANKNMLALIRSLKLHEEADDPNDSNLELASNFEVVFEGDKSNQDDIDYETVVKTGKGSRGSRKQKLTSLPIHDLDDIEKNMEEIHGGDAVVKEASTLNNAATVEDVLDALEEGTPRKRVIVNLGSASSRNKNEATQALIKLPKDVKIKPVEKYQSDLGKYKASYRSGVYDSLFLEANDYLLEFGLLKSNVRHLRCTVASCSAHALQKSAGDGVFDSMVEVTVPHNHYPPNEHAKVKEMFLCVMRKRMQTDKSLNIRTIYEDACKQDMTIKQIVPLRNVINEICRHQLTHKMKPITSFEDFYYSIEYDTFEKLHFTHNYQQFYQDRIMVEEEGSMAILFGNLEVIKQVSKSSVMYVDASFKIDTNEDFDFQLVTVLVWIDDSYYPILYTLINKKTQRIFRKIFELLHTSLAPNLRPQEIITDYEANLYYALAETYVDCNIGGSVFYYTQNLYKQVCSLNLSKDLETNSYFRNIYHMLLMLPLLPVNTILDGLNSIEVEAKNLKISDLARPIFDHVRVTWMLNVTPELFCVHKLENRINENVIAPFKKFRDFLLLSKGKLHKTHVTIVHVVEKIIELEDFLRTTYAKPDKKSFGRDLSSYQKKNVLRAWQFIEDHPKIEINNFFSKVLGYIKCMENQLWIWGFYRYNGDSDDVLINASHFSILSLDDEQGDNGEKAEYLEYVGEQDHDVHTVVMEAVIDQDGVLQTEVETTTEEDVSQNQKFESAFLKYVYQ